MVLEKCQEVTKPDRMIKWGECCGSMNVVIKPNVFMCFNYNAIVTQKWAQQQ